MNHHEFRVLITSTPNEVIKSYGIGVSYFKAVCLALSMYGDYETGTNIRPSWLTIAKDAGVNRKTAMKVRDILLDTGVLVHKWTSEGNISVYDFGAVVQIDAFQLSLLDEQLSKYEDQLSIQSGHNTTINTTKDTTLILHEEAEASSTSNLIIENQEEVVYSTDINYINIKEMNSYVDSLWS
jgi:hypothetical protein